VLASDSSRASTPDEGDKQQQQLTVARRRGSLQLVYDRAFIFLRHPEQVLASQQVRLSTLSFFHFSSL